MRPEQKFRCLIAPLAAAGALLLMLTTACAQHDAAPPDAELVGLTFEEVEARLGPPDRRAFLDGKDLEIVDDVRAADAEGKRTVYIYEKQQLHVWFKDGRVTTVNRVAAGPPEDAPDTDH